APGGDDMGTNPAYGILSCWLGGGYAWAQGTSMATPYVAGLAAIIAAKYPSRTADQIAWTIQEAAHDLGAAGRDDRFGFGRIDAQKSLGQNATGIDETHGGISYIGTWSTQASAYASGSSYKSASNIGSEATYQFNGTHVAWLTKTGPSEGIADVYLDGVLQGSVDLYDAQDPWQYIGFNADNLASGAHTLRIEATGTKNVASSGTEVIIDALDVEGTTILSSPPAPLIGASDFSYGMDTNLLLAIALLLTAIGASLVFKKTYRARHAKRFLH
ncbi:MAG: S8 family serine peptidase, partial [Candidatus Aquicultor sp.]